MADSGRTLTSHISAEVGLRGALCAPGGKELPWLWRQKNANRKPKEQAFQQVYYPSLILAGPVMFFYDVSFFIKPNIKKFRFSCFLGSSFFLKKRLQYHKSLEIFFWPCLLLVQCTGLSGRTWENSRKHNFSLPSTCMWCSLAWC